MRLFTIGHSNHSTDSFIELLTRTGVTAIADVRSTPHSRWSPHFNKDTLKASLAASGIAYSFLGAELGGRPATADLYTPSGQADYEAMARSPSFGAGLERVLAGAERYIVALMCSEKEPLDCHRCLLVGRHICGRIDLAHIHADGRVETHEALEDRLLSVTRLERDLISPRGDILDMAYRVRAGVAAYKKAV